MLQGRRLDGQIAAAEEGSSELQAKVRRLGKAIRQRSSEVEEPRARVAELGG